MHARSCYGMAWEHVRAGDWRAAEARLWETLALEPMCVQGPLLSCVCACVCADPCACVIFVSCTGASERACWCVMFVVRVGAH